MDPTSSLLDSINQAASSRSPSAQDVLAHASTINAPSELVASHRTTSTQSSRKPGAAWKDLHTFTPTRRSPRSIPPATRSLPLPPPSSTQKPCASLTPKQVHAFCGHVELLICARVYDAQTFTLLTDPQSIMAIGLRFMTSRLEGGLGGLPQGVLPSCGT